MSVTITETTIVDIGEYRVGVGGIREKTYRMATGEERRGPTAILTVVDAQGNEVFDERVHPGQRLAIGDSQWQVDAVRNPAGALGSVTLCKVSP